MPIPYLILIPVICGLIAQFLKSVFKPKKLHLRTLISYGGMPSSHAAFLASLCTVIALREGVNSVAFAICCVITLIMLRDAFGLRIYLGNHGKTLNKLIAKLPLAERRELPDHLEDRIGHRISEILVGLLLGVGLSLILYSLYL